MSDSQNSNLSSTTSTGISSTRLSSIDALRGFTMIWIIGAEEVIRSLFKVWPNSFTETLAINMTHAKWEGYYFYDLVFPLFLFLVGVLLPYTISVSIL